MNDNTFKLSSEYQPKGDQPFAIKKMLSNYYTNKKFQTLLGVTGSGKTFSIANVIQKISKPTLVIAPNKTLAAQLFSELKSFFPNNSVNFFISFYDYYQPEAYLPSSNTYIEKDSAINDDIDKMRHSATMALFEQKDVIIVASVSCIYGLGSPSSYSDMMVRLEIEQNIKRDVFLKKLIDIQYSRQDKYLERGTFRVRGETIDILPANQKDKAIRICFWGDEIESITLIDPINGQNIEELSTISIFPNSHYITEKRNIKDVVREILTELGDRLRELNAQNKVEEYQRLEQRTMRDIELLEQIGFCPGIENYSRFLNGKKPGEAPPTLLDYFPEDYLTIIDESHITIPQIRGMFHGDHARKKNLVNYGFRLPAALDNRPLNFDEFIKNTNKAIFVSATPGKYEQEHCKEAMVEQIIRPTGLLDPKISIFPASNQIDHLFDEIKKVLETKGRVIITTLTKKMSEDISLYYSELGIKIQYLHSGIDSLERVEILRDLRKGVFDVIVGINLLREGLDLPEVKLVAIMDADKEGFLRSRSSLIQMVGRAARNSEGRVIFYADKHTDSMRQAIEETNRRRVQQLEYNAKHNITPQTIIKAPIQGLREIYGLTQGDESVDDKIKDELIKKYKIKDTNQIEKLVKKLKKQQLKYAGDLKFEKAADIRDDIKGLIEIIFESKSD